MWNSVLSTKGTKYMCLDIKNFYLTAPLDRYEYMKMPLSLFPSWIKEQYNLDKHAKNGFVYLEMRRAVWGLPQAGILANKLLRQRLLPHGYYECKHTPGLWRHLTRPISFTLVVDDFGVKYVGKEHVDHLIKCIKEKYELNEDWSGDLYCDHCRRSGTSSAIRIPNSQLEHRLRFSSDWYDEIYQPYIFRHIRQQFHKSVPTISPIMSFFACFHSLLYGLVKW